MKIVILHDDFPPESSGGAGVVAASFAKQLHDTGHQVSVITTTPRRENVGIQEWEGVRVYRIYSSYHERWRSWRSLYNPVVVREVRQLLHTLNPEIVHAHNVHYHLSYASLKVAKNSGAKVFLTAHDVMLVLYGKMTEDSSAWGEFRQQKWRYNPFRNFFIRRALRNLNGLFAVSEALQRFLENHDVRVAAVLYNGIAVADWDSRKGETDAFTKTHGLRGKRVLFFGGRISFLKGGGALLEALPIIIRSMPETVCVVAGKENDYLRRLQNRAKELGVGSAFVSIGWLSKESLKDAYLAADIVLQPSIYFEPFGLIALEGMACGKPVVAGNVGGLPEIVKDGDTGYIVDPRDTQRLSSAIIKLLSDPALATRMGTAGRSRAQSNFSLERQTATLVSWYEK